MKTFVDDSRAEWMNDRLELYLDDELQPEERLEFETIVSTSTYWQNELRLARRIQYTFHSAPQPVCPDRVTQKVMSQVIRLEQERRFLGWIDFFRAGWNQVWQPALVTATLVFMVIASTLVNDRPRPDQSAEIAQATQEVKWALAYLSKVGKDTGHVVKQDVLQQRVVAPVRGALESVLSESPENRF